jgi:hypothetical protein
VRGAVGAICQQEEVSNWAAVGCELPDMKNIDQSTLLTNEPIISLKTSPRMNLTFSPQYSYWTTRRTSIILAKRLLVKTH